MTPYELMIKTNEHLIKGGILNDKQKQNITARFLEAVSDKNTADRFYRSVKYPGNIDGEGRRMYPVYFIPPYNNGKKYRTVTCVTPGTHILSANAYELEIIRLLHILDPENSQVCEMAEQTAARLRTTCFGNLCNAGECFESGVIALRFICSVLPDDTQWIKKLIGKYKEHINDKKRHSGIVFYYFLCLYEMPEQLALPEVEVNKDTLLRNIKRSFVLNSESDRYMSPLYKYILRNCLARLPEYRYLKDREPFEENGRLHFNTEV